MAQQSLDQAGRRNVAEHESAFSDTWEAEGDGHAQSPAIPFQVTNTRLCSFQSWCSRDQSIISIYKAEEFVDKQ